MAALDHFLQEVLEIIWMLREEGVPTMDRFLERVKTQRANEALGRLEEEGLVRRDGEELYLTTRGLEAAAGIVRRHRLAECLLSEVLDMEYKYLAEEACRYDHILSPRVAEAICTLLGHPSLCPHGRPIPQGECCLKFSREVKPLVVQLSHLPVGDRAKVVFIAPHSHARLNRLSSLGLVPGSTVELHQKSPSFVIELGETTLALDSQIAEEIFVKPL